MSFNNQLDELYKILEELDKIHRLVIISIYSRL